MTCIPIVKAHAFGNDFLLLEERHTPTGANRAALARAACARHTGIGADGLILYTRTTHGASMRLLNADGSRTETSVRGLQTVEYFQRIFDELLKAP